MKKVTVLLPDVAFCLRRPKGNRHVLPAGMSAHTDLLAAPVE